MKNSAKVLFFLLFVNAALLTEISAEEPFVPSESMNGIQLNRYMSIYEDKTENLTIKYMENRELAFQDVRAFSQKDFFKY